MLTSKQILERCGLLDLPKPRSRQKWMPATLKFLGAEHYVLSTRDVEVSLTTKSGGFGLFFRHPPKINAADLLGRTIKHGVLVDVEIALPEPMPVLSLAALTTGLYPRVLRTGEVIHV